MLVRKNKPENTRNRLRHPKPSTTFVTNGCHVLYASKTNEIQNHGQRFCCQLFQSLQMEHCCIISGEKDDGPFKADIDFVVSSL